MSVGQLLFIFAIMAATFLVLAVAVAIFNMFVSKKQLDPIVDQNDRSWMHQAGGPRYPLDPYRPRYVSYEPSSTLPPEWEQEIQENRRRLEARQGNRREDDPEWDPYLMQRGYITPKGYERPLLKCFRYPSPPPSYTTLPPAYEQVVQPASAILPIIGTCNQPISSKLDAINEHLRGLNGGQVRLLCGEISRDLNSVLPHLSKLAGKLSNPQKEIMCPFWDLSLLYNSLGMDEISKTAEVKVLMDQIDQIWMIFGSTMIRSGAPLTNLFK